MKFENLEKAVDYVKNQKFDITISKKNVPQLHQTQRNTAKAILEEGLLKDLEIAFPSDVFRHSGGKSMEIENQSIADNLPDHSLGDGSIIITFDIAIGNLDQSRIEMEEEFEIVSKQKQEIAEEKERKKQAKIKRDMAEREKRKAEKEKRQERV